MDYPIGFEAEYGDGKRNQGLAVTGALFYLKLILAVPHLVITGILQNLAAALAYVGYFFIAFTGRQPDGIVELVTKSLDWQGRIWAWFWGGTDAYPPFALDAPGYPARATFDQPTGERSTGWAVAGIFFIKFLAAIPHLIALAFVAIGAFFAAWYGFIVTAVTGTLPRGVHDYLTGVMRWSLRLGGWLASLTDEYPPFRLAG